MGKNKYCKLVIGGNTEFRYENLNIDSAYIFCNSQYQCSLTDSTAPTLSSAVNCLFITLYFDVRYLNFCLDYPISQLPVIIF